MEGYDAEFIKEHLEVISLASKEQKNIEAQKERGKKRIALKVRKLQLAAQAKKEKGGKTMEAEKEREKKH